MIDATERLCQILVKTAEMENLHSLLLCRIQQGNETTNFRDMAIANSPTHQKAIMSRQLLPATYNLTKLDYKPIQTLLQICDIPLNARHVRIQILAQQIRRKLLDKEPIITERKRKKLEKKLANNLLEERGIINLNDPRTLWFPLSKWLTIETFEETCRHQLKEGCPFENTPSINLQPNTNSTLISTSVRDYFGEDFEPRTPEDEVD